MQQGKLERGWLPLGLCAVYDGDEQMLEKSFIALLVTFFPPVPLTLSTLKLHGPVQIRGQQCAKLPHCGDPGQLILCACRDHSQTPSCGCSRPRSENKAVAWRQFWLLMCRECHRQPGNEPPCNPTSGSCVYIDPWKQFSSLAHHSHP